MRSLWLDAGGTILMLERSAVGGRTVPVADDPPGLHLLALGITASERGAWRRRLSDAGHEPYAATDFTLYVEDPEGNRIGLSHWPDPAE